MDDAKDAPPGPGPAWREDLYEIQRESTLLLEQVFGQAVERLELKWRDRLALLQRRHEIEHQGLHAQVAEAQDQLNETVKMYNGIISNLQEEMDGLKQRSLKTEELLKSELQSSSHQIEDTTSSYQAAISSLTKQLTEAREVASNNELKAQQRKLVLLQSNEALKREKEELAMTVEDLEEQVRELQEELQALRATRRAAGSRAAAVAAAEAALEPAAEEESPTAAAVAAVEQRRQSQQGVDGEE